MGRLKNNIKQLIEDVFDDLGIPVQYDEKYSCFVTVPISLQGVTGSENQELLADVIVMLVRIHEDAFSVSVFCAGYEPNSSNMTESLAFAGLLNNVCLAGNCLRYHPEMPMSIFRYVDCVNTQEAPPSVSKIVKNLNIVLADYVNYMDTAIAVDLGILSAVDAYNMLFSE